MTDLDPDRVQQAARTYLYGYPLVYCLDEIAKIPAGSPLLDEAAPFNSFGAARHLLDADAEFVTPNNDTLYLLGALDLSGGPVLLTVPDTGDRYYVLQFVDAWSNNVAYVGTRATGNRAGTFLIVPGGWTGDTPDGATTIEMPTSVGIIVGRVAVSGDADVAAVHAIQDQFSLAPLDPGAARAGIPQPEAGVPDELVFWEKLRLALRAFPNGDVDAPFVAVAARFGLTDETSPFVDPDPDLAAVLVAGQQAGSEQIDGLSRTAIQIVDGWASAMHAFDYNLDHLGLGTIASPEWTIADRTTAYVLRAVAARQGLWGNHGYEAVYDILWTDADGRPLDGSGRYELTLPSAPPTGAFWSLTNYAEPHYYLVANPIDRFAIGDRTEGLQVADDGSITIYVQADDPGGAETANWLPAPTGGFRPVLRNYLPDDDVLEGRYVLPPIRRVG